MPSRSRLPPVDYLVRLYPAPSQTAIAKALDHIDPVAEQFIGLSTFYILATADAHGAMDVSPRGGPPGFVVRGGPGRLILPDRPGNNRLDSLRNLAGRRSGVALLFLIPGVDETLRVSGQAVISIDSALLESLDGSGRLPRSALIVDVQECFLHCSKALVRGELWDGDAQADRMRSWRAAKRVSTSC